MTSNHAIEQAFANAESVATIGSPSTTTEIKMNIRGAAAENKLVGEMAVLKYRQQGATQYALGQITEVRLQNRMLEDHAMLTLARRRGQVDHVSEDQDTHDGEMRISAVYSEDQGNFRESSMGTVPPTGTDIKKATNAVVNEIIHAHLDNVFYLGTSYQSDLDLPMWLRQFNGAPGQLAEAHHIGIFGRSGSGKSTLAKLILLAYATHPEMGILIVDPQGEFAKGLTGQPEQFQLNIAQRIQELGREIINIDVTNIVLSSWDLVEELLTESRFVNHSLGIHPRGNPEAPREAALRIRRALQGRRVVLASLHTRDAFDNAWEAVIEALQGKQIYSGDTTVARVASTMERADRDAIFYEDWRPMMNLFNTGRDNARGTGNIIRSMLSNRSGTRPIVNINLAASSQNDDVIQWNDRIRNIVVNQLLSEINRYAEDAYRDNVSLNTLVVIDEAHRLAPAQAPSDDDYARRIRTRLADSARTTRKYGLGWMFISQSLASISTDIVGQTRIQFFGYGLSMGSELEALSRLVGGDRHKINLYQSFRDPESAFSAESREYSFMAAGPISPLCLTASPVFLSVYNHPQIFFAKNQRAFPSTQA